MAGGRWYAGASNAATTFSEPTRRLTRSPLPRAPPTSTPRSAASALSSRGENVSRIARVSEGIGARDARGGRIKLWRRFLPGPLDDRADLALDDPGELPRDLGPHLRGHELQPELHARLRELRERVSLAELRLHEVPHRLADLDLQVRVRVEPAADVRLHLVLHEVPHRLDEQVLRMH